MNRLPGRMPTTPPTLADVAERAGVSRQTVSNAVNNPDLLRADTLMRVQEAINLPNLIAGGSFYAAEVDKFPPELKAGLEAKGVKLSAGFGAEGSGLHGVEVTPEGLRGGADPRREGVAKAP